MKRFNYFVDRRIASGTGTLLAWLGVLSLIVLVIFAIFNTFALSSETGSLANYIESFWTALSVAVSPEVNTEPGWLNRLFLLLIAIFWNFYFIDPNRHLN